MRILIIGGTGLISTLLTRFLLERGEDVTIYNRSNTPVRLPSAVRIVRGDRTQYAEFETQMREFGTFDCVIDMVGFVPQDAESAVRAFAGRVEQFIFCSTVDVYRKPATRYPYTESESYGGFKRLQQQQSPLRANPVDGSSKWRFSRNHHPPRIYLWRKPRASLSLRHSCDLF